MAGGEPTLDYTTWDKQMKSLLVVPLDSIDTNYENIKLAMISYAELRIYRELDFITTMTAQTGVLTPSSRNVVMPTGIIILSGMNVITPASASNPDLGTRNQLVRVSLDVLDYMSPSSASVTGVPGFYALLTDTSVRVGLAPDQAYTAEFKGTVRPAMLTPANPTTYITLNLPDLFIAACMVFGSGYRKNFGAQSDDPKMAMSWEAQYQAIKQGVNVEALRQKAQSWEWTATQPSALANQPRDRPNAA